MSSPVDGLDDGITSYGVRGRSYDRGYGVFGYTNAVDKAGVIGLSIRGDGVVGESYRNGVVGRGDNYGVTTALAVLVFMARAPCEGVFGTGGKEGVVGALLWPWCVWALKRLWCVWREQQRHRCVWHAATALVCLVIATAALVCLASAKVALVCIAIAPSA